MRVKSKVNVRIFDSTAERDVLFGPDDTRAEVTNDNHTEHMSGRFVVDASDSLVLPLGTVGAPAGIYVRTLTDFDISIDGGAPLEIRKPSGLDAADPVKFYMDGVFTSAAITNTSATASLTGYYAVWGDPV